MKPEEMLVLPIEGALVFFDLAGTLVEPDGRLQHHRQTILQRLGRHVRRIVLVTGQPLDDPQVQDILAALTLGEPCNLVAYTTRGGLRLKWHGGTWQRDLTYLADTRLEAAVRRAVEQEVAQILNACQLSPLIPVECIDDVAVRVNLQSAERPQFITALTARLEAVGMRHLQVTAEGRTSVFVMLQGVGKRWAVQYELAYARREGILGPAFYFGNEVAVGNDREVLGLPGLEICALGSCGPVPPDSRCRTIGHLPDDLYTVIEASLACAQPADRRLPVVCLSLGGTKVEVGALTQHGIFLASEKIYWRDSPVFSGLLDDTQAGRFCEVLLRQIHALLEQQGYTWADVGVLGIAFPGPRNKGLWYSNNLIRAFERGVALEREMAEVLTRMKTTVVPRVQVMFDAQCDAGGELYHPAGRLRSHVGSTLYPSATVLNMASGIAAGFVSDGKVLVDERDICTQVHPGYDGGAGQLGRHLWYHPDQRRWLYHFRPGGRVPTIDAPAVRMTECLSGPALAARLLLRLGSQGLLPDSGTWTVSDVTASDVADCYQVIANCDPQRDLAAASQAVRGTSRPVAGALLSWANDIYHRAEPTALDSCLRAFSTEVAADLAGALTAWMRAEGWGHYGRHIVLTGTVGIQLLASSDAVPQRSFLHALAAGLPSGCRVERSRLLGAAERECYLFLHQTATNVTASAGSCHR